MKSKTNCSDCSGCAKSLLSGKIPEKELNRQRLLIDILTGKQNTMGIIEIIKKIEREDAFEKGTEEGKSEVVANLINTGKFTISEIANFANVSELFVRKIRKGQKK